MEKWHTINVQCSLPGQLNISDDCINSDFKTGNAAIILKLDKAFIWQNLYRFRFPFELKLEMEVRIGAANASS